MRAACLVLGLLLWSATDAAVPAPSQSAGSAAAAGKFDFARRVLASDVSRAAPAAEHVQAELERLGLGAARRLDRLDADLQAAIAGRVTYLLLRPTDLPTVRESFGQQNPFPAWLPGSLPGTFAHDHLLHLFQKQFPRAEVRSIAWRFIA